MESNKIASQVVVVTGSSSGIGRATVQRLQARGHIVIATARHVSSLNDVGASLSLPLDVTDENAVERALASVIEQYGRIDAVVNNAGYGQRGAIEDVDQDAVHHAFDVNVYGPLRLIRAVVPIMRRQRQGRIINVSSVVGRASMPMMGIYCATKYAVEAFSDSLRMEVSSFGIDVVVVEPGLIRTDFSRNAEKASHAILNKETSPYRRWYMREDRLSYQRYAVGPDRVARIIQKAIESSRPHTRYQVPFSAALIVQAFPLLRLLGFDRVMAGRIHKTLRDS